MIPHLQLMLKPASGMCNLRCRYCFYADETSKRCVANYGIMSLNTAENIIKKALANAKFECTFAFQGGEPTLAGLSFFRTFVDLVNQHNTNHRTVHYVLQTNGTLLNDEWADFFYQNHFLIGVSLDGTKDLHDSNRIDTNGNGTHTQVLRSIKLLERHQVNTNILTVLTSDSCRRFQKIYSFYAKHGWKYQQYIPCLDPLGEPREKNPWSLSPERFETYLKTAFDCWYKDAMSGQKVYHRFFDNLLLLLDGQVPEACGMNGRCGIQYVIEADGSVYPCDFYMLDEHCLGNLNTNSFEELDESRKQLGFIEQSVTLASECTHCRWYTLCRGGCRRDRDYFAEGIHLNFYCSAYKSFYEYAYPRLIQLYQYLTS